MASVPPLVLIGTAVICLGALLNIVGLSTPSWQKLERTFTMRMTVHTTTLNAGLFKVCGKECKSVEDPSSGVAATQAMVIIGMLASFAAGGSALLYVLLNLLSKNAPQLLPIATLISSCGAFGAIIIGVIIYATEVFDPDVKADLGYSFALCVVGAVLLVAGGVVEFLGTRSAQYRPAQTSETAMA